MHCACRDASSPKDCWQTDDCFAVQSKPLVIVKSAEMCSADDGQESIGKEADVSVSAVTSKINHDGRYPFGACVLMNDDGSSSFLNNTLHHLTRDTPLTIAVIPEKCDTPGFMRLEELRALCTDSSFRITTCTHMDKCLVPFSPPPPDGSAESSYESAALRLDANIAWLRDRSLRWEVCVYAQGSHDARIRELCQTRFRMSLGVTPRPWDAPLATWAAPRVALQALPRLHERRRPGEVLRTFPASLRSWASYTPYSLEYFVRWAASECLLLVLFDHGVETFQGFGWPDVFEVLDKYRVPVIDLYDAIGAFGNQESCGDYVHPDDPNAWGRRPRQPWRIVSADGTVFEGRGGHPSRFRHWKRLIWSVQRRVKARTVPRPTRDRSF